MIAPSSGLTTALVLAGSRGGTDPVAAYEESCTRRSCRSAEKRCSAG